MIRYLVEYSVYANVGGNFEVRAASLVDAAVKAAAYIEECGLGHPEHLVSIESA